MNPEAISLRFLTAVVAVVVGSLALPGSAGAAEEASICYGTTANGRLENAVALPRSGDNFEAYSYLAGPLGRTYVHSVVRDIILDAYAILAKKYPEKVYKYAETGFREGGPFDPHKTHQNGLSVDFTVPVIDREGKSVTLPTNVFNKWGYDVEFDQQGAYEDLVIDFESMAAHLEALHEAAKKKGVRIWRVIFDPVLQSRLYETRRGEWLRRHILIPTKASWVRHDDHYHVDFEVGCRPMDKHTK